MRMLLFTLTMGLGMIQAQERFYHLPDDLDSSLLLLRRYPVVDTNWGRQGREDERFFRRQQRRWNRQVATLNDTLARALLAYPYPTLLADSAAFDSARAAGAHYLLESTFAFGLRHETFWAGEAVLDGELVPYYRGPVKQQTSYDPLGQGEVTAPSGYTPTRLYYWRIRDLETGDEYYFETNQDQAISEKAGLYGSLPFALPGLIEEIKREEGAQP